ncbi:MAG: phage tail protein, partial [Staphylococcus epidermidis]|nr:phage tail protein [Staphylococcus epidermidis]
AAGGVMGFGVMAASAIKMLNDGTLQATAETKKYQSALEGVQDAWQGIIEKNQSQIFNTMANGLNMIKVALAGLSPFISGVSKGMEQASAKMLDWAKNSQVAQKFFQMMGTTGVRIFNNMLSAVGNFGSGVVSVLTQLAPLADWAAAGFKRMGQAFNSWAQSSAGQEAIKSFVEYTKQNLPLIGQIFSNTFKGIFNLMKAFAPNTHSILESLAHMSEKFASWSATVAKSDGFKKFMDYVNTNGPKLMSLLGNLVMIIINVATAMAPLAAKVLDVAIAMTEFIKNLTAAHPAIGILLGLIATLAGVLMTLGPPILFVIDFIGTFIKAFTGAGKVIEGLMSVASALTPVFEAIGVAIAAIDAPILLIIAGVAALIAIFVALWNSSSVLRNALIGAWNAIKSAVGAAIQAVIGFLGDLLS